MADIRRACNEVSVTIASSGTQSGDIPIDDFAFGIFYQPAAVTGTSYTVEAKDSAGTYYTICDKDGTNISITVANSKASRLPDEIFAADTIRLVSSASEAAQRTLKFNFKS